MPLHALLMRAIGTAPWALALTGGLFVIGIALLLTFMSNTVGLFTAHNHLPALAFPVLLGLAPGGLLPGPAMTGLPFVLWAMWSAWAPGGRRGALMPLFDAGMLIGVAGMFHLPYLFTVVPIWASLSVMRPFQWREYMLPLLGALAVFFLAWGIVHLSPGMSWDPIGSLRTPPPPVWDMHWMHRLVLIAWVVCCAAATIWSAWSDYSRSVMQGKNMRAAFLAFGFTLVLLALFNLFLNDAFPAVLLAAPGAVLFSYPLLRSRSPGWAEAGLWGLLLLALWGRWVG
jgi:hypothetical protein